MATTRKKTIQARDVSVENRTLEGVLIDLAEQAKATDARVARALEVSAQAEERSARAEEQAALALNALSAMHQDMIALTQEIRAYIVKSDERLTTLERARNA